MYTLWVYSIVGSNALQRMCFLIGPYCWTLHTAVAFSKEILRSSPLSLIISPSCERYLATSKIPSSVSLGH